MYVLSLCFIYKLTRTPSQEACDLGLALKGADCGTGGNGWKTHRIPPSEETAQIATNPLCQSLPILFLICRYQTTLQHTYSQLPQEEPWGAGMMGYTVLELPLQHTRVSCPCCLLLKAQLQLIHQCSSLIYPSSERGFCRLCKSHESSFSFLIPFLV